TPYHNRLEWDAEALRRAGEELQEIRSRFHLSLSDGGGGSLPLERVVGLPRALEKTIEDGFAPDRAIRLLRNWAQEIGRAKRPKLPRGTRGVARRAYERSGELLGVCLT
ncbi:MAG TPA: hypothetical protein VJS68_01240, partial [Thermoplasmata archaeon]|nr:hypothetical protein [Thermoplasmata archaeon]